MNEIELRIKHGLYNPYERRGVRINGKGKPHIFKNARGKWSCRNAYGSGTGAKPISAYNAWRRDYAGRIANPRAPWNRDRQAAPATARQLVAVHRP